jgi:hypothetical protein
VSGELAADVASKEEGEPGNEGGSERLERLLGLPEAAASGSSPLVTTVEFLGLSFLFVPGILDLSERKDRDESLVSDLLKDG